MTVVHTVERIKYFLGTQTTMSIFFTCDIAAIITEKVCYSQLLPPFRKDGFFRIVVYDFFMGSKANSAL